MNEVNCQIPGSPKLIKPNNVSMTTTTTHRWRPKAIPQPKIEDSRDATPQHSQSEEVRSGAINDGIDALPKDLVCVGGTETLKP